MMKTHYQRTRKLWSNDYNKIKDPLSGLELEAKENNASIPISKEYPANICKLEAIKLDLSITASANFSGLFQSELNVDYDYYVILLEVCTPKMVLSSIYQNRFSTLGVRLACGMESSSIKSESKLNIGGGAADLSLNAETFSGYTKSQGIDETQNLEKLIIGGFNMSSMEELGKELPKPINWVTSENLKEFSEIETYVAQEESYQEIVRTTSLSYALLAITDKKSYETAKVNILKVRKNSSLEKKKFLECIDMTIVRIVYLIFGLDEKTIPNDDQKNRAYQIWYGNIVPEQASNVNIPNKLNINYPVEPYLIPYKDDKYIISSLLTLAPKESIIAAIETIPASAKPQRMHSSQGVSADIAINAGFGDMVDVQSKLEVRYLIVNSLLSWKVPGVKDSIINTETYVRGFRVCIKYIGSSSTANLSLPGIAADTELNIGQSTFAVQTIGLSVKEMKGLGDLIALSTGPFDANALKIFGQFNNQLLDMLGNKPTGLECIAEVEINANHKVFNDFGNEMTTYMYAINRIYYKIPFDKAIENLTNQKAKERIKQIYITLFKIQYPFDFQVFDPTKPPTQVMANYANEIYYLFR